MMVVLMGAAIFFLYSFVLVANIGFVLENNTGVVLETNTRVVAVVNTGVVAETNTRVVAVVNTGVVAETNTRVVLEANTRVEGDLPKVSTIGIVGKECLRLKEPIDRAAKRRRRMYTNGGSICFLRLCNRKSVPY